MAGHWVGFGPTKALVDALRTGVAAWCPGGGALPFRVARVGAAVGLDHPHVRDSRQSRPQGWELDRRRGAFVGAGGRAAATRIMIATATVLNGEGDLKRLVETRRVARTMLRVFYILLCTGS